VILLACFHITVWCIQLTLLQASHLRAEGCSRCRSRGLGRKDGSTCAGLLGGGRILRSGEGDETKGGEMGEEARVEILGSVRAKAWMERIEKGWSRKRDEENI